MKLKCRKIRGVEKSVCTREQVIAYNCAFNLRSMFRRRLKAFTETKEKEELYKEINDNIIKLLKIGGIDKKYNNDAIMIAFWQGFRNYCEHDFIAWDYAQVGEHFKIPFEII